MQETQNTKTVQDMFAAFGRGDVKALVGSVADNVVWLGVYWTGPNVPTSGERRGKPSVEEFFKQVGANMNFSSFEPKEFIATGNKVVVLGHYTATTPAKKGFDSDFAMVFTLENGKVTHFQEFCNSAAINAAY